MVSDKTIFKVFITKIYFCLCDLDMLRVYVLLYADYRSLGCLLQVINPEHVNAPTDG